ncbi:MAG: Crp/Fnr family transcriptional regulator [Alphaproteobacteria bacterium]|nr:Crp/Fnr family transcriptional regulator [Alphaproteobacteria bacterium]MBV8406478.1 Crp/Fnr family transcriptional regulator [Alphaproteobacteria bacterium]
MAAAFRNRLLAALCEEDREVMRPLVEFTPLSLRQSVEAAGKPITHAYFPESGCMSVMAQAPGHNRRIEVALIGYEGMSGLGLVLGDNRAVNEVGVRIAGGGWRVAAESIVEAMRESTTLYQHLLRYVHAFIAQASQTALSHGRAKLDERLARWLLMSHDRFQADRLNTTHDYVAETLGVRRAGITLALHALEAKGLIRSARNQITICDREGLCEHANGSYGVAEAVYARLFGGEIALSERGQQLKGEEGATARRDSLPS